VAVAHETAVTLQVSKGPETIPAPELEGVDEATAIERITSGRLTYDEKGRAEQFHSTLPKGTVIAAFGVNEAGERFPLPTGTPYLDQRPVTLLISAGGLPAISGMTYDDAKASLAAVEVGVIEGSHVFDDTVPADRVVRADPQVAGAPIAPGETVLLVISKGVDLVEIPDIIGESINEASRMLKEAGFAVKVATDVKNPVFWGVAEVQSFTPGEEGGSLKRGTEITIKSYYD
jgi:serine/threonine-protein kinase